MSGVARFDLHDRVALVTGASSGIGRATAVALAGAGADVVLAVRTPSKAEGLAAEIAAMGRRAFTVAMDVTDLSASLDALDHAIERAGKVDILVNNAGGGTEERALAVRAEEFDRTMAMNVKAPFFLSQRFAHSLVEASLPGNIVNVSSQAALVALPGEAAYCLAKAALSHMTRCLAVEWGEHGILVNAVAPTFIVTPGTEVALSDDAFRTDTIERVAALKRLGTPEEVAGAIVFLASPAASLVTGHNLVIDGGWTAR